MTASRGVRAAAGQQPEKEGTQNGGGFYPICGDIVAEVVIFFTLKKDKHTCFKMTIIIFLVDTSASMNQRTYLGTSLLDVAKGAVETFMKVRIDRKCG